MGTQRIDPPPRSAEELYKKFLAQQAMRKNEDAERLIKQRTGRRDKILNTCVRLQETGENEPLWEDTTD